MIALLGLVSGFVSPFVTTVLKLLQSREDHAHELAMRELDLKAAAQQGRIDLDATLAKGDIEDAISARRAQPSYGNRLLDAMASVAKWSPLNIVKGFLVLALSLVEVANGFMRPMVVYYVMGAWGAVKLARFYLMLAAAGGAHDWSAVAMSTAIWDDHDVLVVDYVVGFLFGSRHQLKMLPA